MYIFLPHVLVCLYLINGNMLTATSLPGAYLQLGRKDGCSHYIDKPLHISILLTKYRNVLVHIYILNLVYGLLLNIHRSVQTLNDHVIRICD